VPATLELHGKGPIWQLFDRFFSRSNPQDRLDRKVQVLEFLHTNQPFTSFPYEPTSLTPERVEDLKSHIDSDWFGGTDWRSWSGVDTEGIVRETIIRALEVSLGLPHHYRSSQGRAISLEDYGLRPGGEPPERNWPIEFWAVSGVPYFAASLTWRRERNDPQRGLVIVTWLTPGAATSLTSARKADDLNPTDATGWTGSWIIRHEVNEVSSPTRAASSGEIVTVSPAEENGGVNAELDY
jgi:hypothetical protein